MHTSGQGWRLAAVAIGLLVGLAPLAQLLPPAAGDAAAFTATLFPFFPGDEGSQTITPSRAEATVHMGPPTVWKERVMWGCEPTGDCILDQAGDETWHRYSGARTVVDLREYDPPPTFVLEAVMDATEVDRVQVRLVNLWTGEVVDGSTVSTSAAEPTLVRSSALSLAGAREYGFEVRVDHAANDRDAGDVYTVKLLSAQPGATDTVTSVRLGGGDVASAGNLVTARRSAIWRYDASALDGDVDVHFEAVASLSGVDGDVELVRASDDEIVTTLDFDRGDTELRIRSLDLSGPLTPGEAYEVQLDNNGFQRMTLHIARIVIEQSDLTRTVRYVDLSWQDATRATSFEPIGYPAIHNGSLEWGPSQGYFEATTSVDLHGASTSALTRALGEAASVRLTNASDGGTVVEGSHLRTTNTAPTRLRTAAAVPLDPSDTVYRAQLRTARGLVPAEVRNAWIVSYQDAGRTYDHVLGNEHRADGAWNVSLDATGSENLSRVENLTVGIRDGNTTDVVATLPSGLDAASAAWDTTRDLAYVFGGFDNRADQTDEIVSFDPPTGDTTVVA